MRCVRFTAVAAPVLALASLLAALPATPALQAQRVPGDCTIDEAELEYNQLEQDMLDALNAYRRALGAPELSISVLLTRTAVWKSSDRAHGGAEAHDDPDRTFDQRFEDCGYNFNAAMGENLAKIEGDLPAASEAAMIVQAWKDSPEHNRVMSDPVYRVVGLSRVFVADTKTTYWTANFGSLTDDEGARARIGSVTAGEGDMASPEPPAPEPETPVP